MRGDNISLITAHGEMTYSWLVERESSKRRLSKLYKSTKVKFIIKIKDLCLAKDYYSVFKRLERVIHGKARKYANAWGKTYKIDVEDLDSLFKEISWILLEYDEYSTSNKLTFYENYINHIDSDVLMNFLRELKTHKRFLSYSNKEVCSIDQTLEKSVKNKQRCV